MIIIKINNDKHLGDNVFTMILFNNIKKYIETNNIIIYYYCLEEYHKQLKEFITSSNIILLNYENISVNIWIGNREFNYNNYNKEKTTSFNDFYVIFFNNLLKKMNIYYNIDKLEYIDNELIDRYNNLNDKYKNIDILIINSDALSGQYDKNENEWERYINLLNSKYNIVITKKINDIYKCTLDDNLTIKDIASISIKTKIIIAINTGVFPALLNNLTLNNVKKIYNFDNKEFYNIDKIKSCKGCISSQIDLNEIYEICSIG